MNNELALAPLEGLADAPLRAVLSAVGGYDWCMAPFVRVSNHVLSPQAFVRVCPELTRASRTESGLPVRVQVLGSDPALMAASIRRLLPLAPAGVDLNFGCPAPTVNRHGGGAALLEHPETLLRVTAAARAEIPADIPFTAKMRLGWKHTENALACAQALAAGGVDALIVHGRTGADGYRPPARWTWIARIREAVTVPVMANGEVWTPADYAALREISGCAAVMLGRGAIADPFLARRLRGEAALDPAGDWRSIVPLLWDYWQRLLTAGSPLFASGRLKQWLAFLRRTWPEAAHLAETLRPLKTRMEVESALCRC
jgi:tRNA-dihydrouridine synthase C